MLLYVCNDILAYVYHYLSNLNFLHIYLQGIAKSSHYYYSYAWQYLDIWTVEYKRRYGFFCMDIYNS